MLRGSSASRCASSVSGIDARIRKVRGVVLVLRTYVDHHHVAPLGLGESVPFAPT